MISNFFYILQIIPILLANNLLLGQFNISGSSSINYGSSQNNFSFTENLIDMNGSWYDWTGWLQLEHAQPPQLGRSFSGIRKFRIEYAKDDYTIKLGDIYEFWGNGLALNMLDDQSIDLDTGIRGGFIKWTGNIYSFEGMLVTQEIWRVSNQVLGFNDRVPNYSIKNTIYGLRGSAFLNKWSGGFHYLNIFEKHPEAISESYNKLKSNLVDVAPDLSAKYLNYPTPKAIVEEWEKVK